MFVRASKSGKERIVVQVVEEAMEWEGVEGS